MTQENRLPTNLRTLYILEVLGQNDRPMSATEINEHLGLPKQTVHRLCATLEENGFVNRVGGSKKYQVARRLRELGLGLLHNSRDHMARRQILSQVAQHVGETVNYVVPEGDGMRYLDRVETDWAFRIQLPIGSNVPFHCTASGKCFLASLRKNQRNALVQNLNFEQKTIHSHKGPETFLKELDEVKKQGYALDQEELFNDLIALSVPVLDQNNRFVAALAMHGPTQRLTVEHLISQVDYMKNAAQKLSELLFTD